LFAVVRNDQTPIDHELCHVGGLTTRGGTKITDELLRPGIKSDSRYGRGEGLRNEIPECGFEGGSRVIKTIAFEKIISHRSGPHRISLSPQGSCQLQGGNSLGIDSQTARKGCMEAVAERLEVWDKGFVFLEGSCLGELHRPIPHPNRSGQKACRTANEDEIQREQHGFSGAPDRWG